MGKPTICAACRHVRRVRWDGNPSATALPEWWRCAATMEERVNFLTGETESRMKTCDLVNFGACEFYEPADAAERGSA